MKKTLKTLGIFTLFVIIIFFFVGAGACDPDYDDPPIVGGGDGGGSNSIPSPPRNFTVERVSYDPSTIELDWDPVDDGYKYYIYRSSTGSGSGNKIDETVMSYYTSFKNSTTSDVFFRVSTVNYSGREGVATNWERAEALAPVISKPTIAPSITSAVRATSGNVNLTWTRVDGATSYRIYSNPSVTPAGYETSYTTSHLCTHRDYRKTEYFRVSAVNSAGEGPLSGWKEVPPLK